MRFVSKYPKIVVTFVLLAILMSGLAIQLATKHQIASAHRASATNGQGVLMLCRNGLGSVTISGHNQRNDYVTWSGGSLDGYEGYHPESSVNRVKLNNHTHGIIKDEFPRTD